MYSQHAKVQTLAANNYPDSFPVIGTVASETPPTPTPIPTATPMPTPTPALIAKSYIPSVSNTSQISSDGTKTATLRTIQNNDGTDTYDITSSDSTTFMFSKTLPANESISIPYNTWSPDNRYFFIQENTGTNADVMVFNDNGDPFGNNVQYLDLSADFSKDAPNALFDQASGWAADNLIVILTKNSDGSEGTSYWYGVPDESITPLATKF
jgi:hypothetical protein